MANKTTIVSSHFRHRKDGSKYLVKEFPRKESTKRKYGKPKRVYRNDPYDLRNYLDQRKRLSPIEEARLARRLKMISKRDKWNKQAGLD